jgi:surface polysaccharide O-acyltransferase-like enzyme
MNKLLRFQVWFLTLFSLFYSNEVLSKSLERVLADAGRKGQTILLNTMPLFALVIGYLYYRGKSEAKERMEQFIIGAVLVSSAFGWSYFFKK